MLSCYLTVRLRRKKKKRWRERHKWQGKQAIMVLLDLMFWVLYSYCSSKLNASCWKGSRNRFVLILFICFFDLLVNVFADCILGLHTTKNWRLHSIELVQGCTEGITWFSLAPVEVKSNMKLSFVVKEFFFFFLKKEKGLSVGWTFVQRLVLFEPKKVHNMSWFGPRREKGRRKGEKKK